MVRIQWPDGAVTEAHDYVALVRSIKYDQWDRYPTARDMCAELLRRAEVLTSRSLRHVEADAKDTFAKLAALGLVTIN